MTIVEYMLSTDPEYLHRNHCREFLHRMTRAQELNPCTKNHSTDKPPCHVPACYPKDKNGRMVGA